MRKEKIQEFCGVKKYCKKLKQCALKSVI